MPFAVPNRHLDRPFTVPYKRLRSQGLSQHLEPKRFCGCRERPFKALIKRLERNFLLQWRMKSP
ncbi:hypothetical protein PanWU01x14_244050, partial [Parasponia andersonii]